MSMQSAQPASAGAAAKTVVSQSYSASFENGKWVVAVSRRFSDGKADSHKQEVKSLRLALLQIENLLSYELNPELIDID